ncbi:SOS response-associated peptidase [Planctomonas sp. JC2975]|uniref:SOS response-associated peptidase n=1 Tax=Planctomonas sp. JC2975 TaxID=2729626 RepID=UPI003211E824
MCGRFAMGKETNESITEFIQSTGRKPAEWSWDWEDRYNIKPTEDIAVIIDSARDRELRVAAARWSLVPPWSETLKMKYPTFNARSEDILSKSTWRKPVQSHRCIVPATAYYEWTGEKGSKIPHSFSRPEGGVLGFAGLYSWWLDKTVPENDDTRWHLTATILTSDAIPNLAGIHDRAPVILPETHWQHWIDPSIVGDQTLVNDAVAAGVAQASTLRIDTVAPFGINAEGPQLLTRIER